MDPRSTIRITIGFIFAFVLLALNAVVSYVALDKLVAANALVETTENTLILVGELRGAVIDAQDSLRGYVISGDDQTLKPYLDARLLITAKLAQISGLTAADAGQHARITSLGGLIDQRLKLMSEVVAERRNRNGHAATDLSHIDPGAALTERIRHVIDEAQSHEQRLLASRRADSEFHASTNFVTNVVAAFINICLLAGLYFVVRRDAVMRRRVSATEHEFNEKLAQSLAELRQRNEEITYLSQMSSFLQTCANAEEASLALARFGPLLFPTECGAIYLFNEAHSYVESIASWGNVGGATACEESFATADCWALRRGRLHFVAGDGASMACAHVTRSHPSLRSYLCAPMIAQGETVGLLYLHARGSEGADEILSEAKVKFATTVAEHIALSLSNITLRETLKQQSVRDPLTGLYNRRYLEEMLDRELQRMERRELPLSLIMIDVDHFKNFNDTFGHEAGDAVLRDLGSVLLRNVRGSDIACRYGGEEFTVILPEAGIETARQRAEILRNAVHDLDLLHNGKPLGKVTLSLGVACFPDHGRRRDLVMQAADAALYDAKHAGRDRVVVYNPKTLKVVPILQPRDSGGH
jgi:diguanylate cyclase (GGDEF)-like protein